MGVSIVELGILQPFVPIPVDPGGKDRCMSLSRED